MRSLLLSALFLVACNRAIATGAGSSDAAGVAQGPPNDLAARADGGAITDGGSSTDAGTCGVCNTPPDSCHAESGTCEGGTCQYAFIEDATCDDGNDCTVGDTCSAGACVGTPMVCDSAPAPVCLSSTSSKTYDTQGTCTGGLCVYQSHTATCSGGACSGGSCSIDACQGITCDAPPSVCYAATGSCAAGSCSYPYAEGATCDDGNRCTTSDSCATGVCAGIPTSCSTPPANTCANASTLKSYTSSGSCSAADGTCSYGFSYASCPTGCASGACKPSGWKAMTSNTTYDLRGVWGASASQVWAVGRFGVVTYYDGTKWEVVTGPVTGNDDLRMVHGSSATDVYAASEYDLFRFDGTSWTKVVRVTDGSFSMTGIWATGNATHDVYVSAEKLFSGGTFWPTLLKVSGSGVITTLANASDTDKQFAECDATSRGIWVNSPTNILVNGCSTHVWNGTTLVPLGTDGVGGKFWSNGPSSIFSIYAGEDFYGSSVGMWNGTKWTTSSTGFDGEIEDLWGIGSKSVYYVGADATSGAIVYWDGVGFTRQAVPSGTGELKAIWGASNGKLFAVGTDGTILTGP